MLRALVEAAPDRFFAGLLAGFTLGLSSFISECGFGGIRKSAPTSAIAFLLSLRVSLSGTTPQNPAPRDLKWGVLVGFAAVTPKLPILKDQSSPLDAVARNFLRNVQRINWMILAPSLVGDLTISIQRSFDLAEVTLTGAMNTELENSDQHPRRDEIAELAQRIFRHDHEEKYKAVGTPQWEHFVVAALEQGTQPVEMIAGAGAPASQGLEAMLSSCVTGMWTAFETMAGDLWEAALNLHPQGLAELKGRRKRLLKGSDDLGSSGDEEDDAAGIKSVPLHEIMRHGYKIENQMGSVLRTRRRFDHLAGIREAYALAFHNKADEIDTLLKYDGLDALNAVRNLLVHRSGIVDRTYERKTKFLQIPTASIGSEIFLDGEIVKDMMTAIVICSFKLIVAVDDWIAAN